MISEFVKFVHGNSSTSIYMRSFNFFILMSKRNLPLILLSAVIIILFWIILYDLNKGSHDFLTFEQTFFNSLSFGDDEKRINIKDIFHIFQFCKPELMVKFAEKILSSLHYLTALGEIKPPHHDENLKYIYQISDAKIMPLYQTIHGYGQGLVDFFKGTNPHIAVDEGLKKAIKLIILCYKDEFMKCVISYLKSMYFIEFLKKSGVSFVLEEKDGKIDKIQFSKSGDPVIIDMDTLGKYGNNGNNEIISQEQFNNINNIYIMIFHKPITLEVDGKNIPDPMSKKIMFSIFDIFLNNVKSKQNCDLLQGDLSEAFEKLLKFCDSTSITIDKFSIFKDVDLVVEDKEINRLKKLNVFIDYGFEKFYNSAVSKDIKVTYYICAFVIFYYFACNLFLFKINPMEISLNFIDVFSANINYVKFNVIEGVYDNIHGAYKFVLFSYHAFFWFVLSIVFFVLSKNIKVISSIYEFVFYILLLLLTLISVIYCVSSSANGASDRGVINDIFGHLDAFRGNRKVKPLLLNKIRPKRDNINLIAILGIIILYIVYSFGIRSGVEFIKDLGIIDNYFYLTAVFSCGLNEEKNSMSVIEVFFKQYVVKFEPFIKSALLNKIFVGLIFMISHIYLSSYGRNFMFFCYYCDLFKFVTVPYAILNKRVKLPKVNNVSLHIDKFIIFEMPFLVNGKKLGKNLDPFIYKFQDALLSGKDLTDILAQCPNEELKVDLTERLNDPQNVLFKDVHMEAGEYNGRYGIFIKPHGSKYVYHFEGKSGLKCQIAGESGSGKSSQAEILTGRRPSSYAKINGIEASLIDPVSLSGMYYGITIYNLFSKLSAEQNYGLSGDLIKSVENLNKASISKIVNKFKSPMELISLSFGEGNRAEAVRAIEGQKKFLIRFLDEVLEGLDDANAQKICNIIDSFMEADQNNRYPILFIIDHGNFMPVHLSMKIEKGQSLTVFVNINKTKTKDDNANKFVNVLDLDFKSKDSIDFEEFTVHRFIDEEFEINNNAS